MPNCPVCGIDRGEEHAAQHVREQKYARLGQATEALAKARRDLEFAYATLVRAHDVPEPIDDDEREILTAADGALVDARNVRDP